MVQQISRNLSGQTPMMVREAVGAIVLAALPGLYVDASFGRGHYSQELLKRLPPGGRLIILTDEEGDPAAARAARDLMRSDPRVEAVLPHCIGEARAALGEQQLAGALVDLGVAHHAGDDLLRALSPVANVPLDLRVRPTRGVAASDWLQSASVSELAWVIHAYGEDDDPYGSLRVAEAIMDWQTKHGPYRTIAQLGDAIRQVRPHNEQSTHPAKLVVQALRVFVNAEMEQLDAFLEGITPQIVPCGRLAIVSTRRVEVAMVKSFMRKHEDVHPLFANTPAWRLRELHPLVAAECEGAVRQACDPMWPAPDASGRRIRTLATHVIERTVRRSQMLLGSCGTQVGSERFVQPAPLLFQGEVVG